jgi:MraZ protein
VTSFLGRYEYQFDERGRVSLPSAFRRESKNDRFVLIQWRKPSLSLFPRDIWTATEERLLTFRRNQPESWEDVLRIVSNAVEVIPDKQGRILIPAWLQKAAGLKGSVLMVGNIDRIELWHPSGFSETIESKHGDFDKFSNQIFG